MKMSINAINYYMSLIYKIVDNHGELDTNISKLSLTGINDNYELVLGQVQDVTEYHLDEWQFEEHLKPRLEKLGYETSIIDINDDKKPYDSEKVFIKVKK